MRKRQAIRCTLMVTSFLFIISATLLIALFAMPLDKRSLPEQRQGQFISRKRIFPQAGEDVKLDQPWSLSTPEVIRDIGFFERSAQSYLVSNFSYSKGMGNLMFQYASLRGIAKRRKSSLVVPINITLRRAFELDAIFVTDEVNDELLKRAANFTIETKSCCDYIPSPENSTSRLMAVIGYLQNPRYFNNDRNFVIQNEFAFIPAVQEQALSFLRALAARRALERARPIWRNGKPSDDEFEMETDALLDDLFYIGVHVRHGIDIEMNGRNVRHGHQAAPADYYRRAMDLAKGKKDNVVFVVCSDNPSWAKKHLPKYDKGMLFSCPGVFREVDMAILSQCDALVLSTGTFSWWSGYLNQKASQIIYYDGWPRPGSELAKMVNRTEFFPSTWTPLA